MLLQGEGGLSRKGPEPAQTSHYYSEPQLAVRGTLGLDRGDAVAVAGRAWLDHEWSDSPLDANAVGWDWIGMNLDDGAALTAFRAAPRRRHDALGRRQLQDRPRARRATSRRPRSRFARRPALDQPGLEGELSGAVAD